MDVVKDEGHVALGNRRQFSSLVRSLPLLRYLSSRLFHRKKTDDLRFAVIKEFKILFMKISDGVALGITYDHAYRDQLDVDLERGCFFVRSNFRGALIRMSLSRSRLSGSCLSRGSLRGRRLRILRLRACRNGEK